MQDMLPNFLTTLHKMAYPIYDNIARKPIPGIEKFANMGDPNKPIPITVLEQGSLSEISAEFSTSCYAGMLML
jgi:hypothetical protein